MLGIVTQGRRVQARMRSLALLNVELAKVEGKQKATALGIAGGLGVVAAVLALYAVGFLFTSAAAALDEALSLWLALLVVAVVILEPILNRLPRKLPIQSDRPCHLLEMSEPLPIQHFDRPPSPTMSHHSHDHGATHSV